MRAKRIGLILIGLSCVLWAISIGTGLHLIPALIIQNVEMNDGKRVLTSYAYGSAASALLLWGMMLRWRMYPFFSTTDQQG